MMNLMKNEHNLLTQEEFEEYTQQVSEITKKVIDKKAEVRKWKDRSTALNDVNWLLSIDLKNCKRTNQYLTEEIDKKTEAQQVGQQEVNWYENRNCQEIRDCWTYYDDSFHKYRCLFVNSFIEYRSDHLHRTINECQAELEVIVQKIMSVEKKIEGENDGFRFIEFNTNLQVQIHQPLQLAVRILSEEVSPLLLTTLSIEKTVRDLKRQIKQKKQSISNLII